MVNTATICMHRHGTYPGLRGSVSQISYSLHMLTTLGRDLLGQDKGIVGQLGTLLSCVVSASYLVYHHTAWISSAYLAMSCDSVLILRSRGLNTSVLFIIKQIIEYTCTRVLSYLKQLLIQFRLLFMVTAHFVGLSCYPPPCLDNE